jgi:hypothetical protein
MREYDINWVTRKGYKPNQYGKVWNIIARAHNAKEARKLFNSWWYRYHNYHAFHVEVRPKGKYAFCHPITADHVQVKGILVAEPK